MLSVNIELSGVGRGGCYIGVLLTTLGSFYVLTFDLNGAEFPVVQCYALEAAV